VYDETLTFKLSPKRSDLQFTLVLIQMMGDRGLLKVRKVYLPYGRPTPRWP
jgi:hypothetical protein